MTPVETLLKQKASRLLFANKCRRASGRFTVLLFVFIVFEVKLLAVVCAIGMIASIALWSYSILKEIRTK
jgi:hypothetical protein